MNAFVKNLIKIWKNSDILIWQYNLLTKQIFMEVFKQRLVLFGNYMVSFLHSRSCTSFFILFLMLCNFSFFLLTSLYCILLPNLKENLINNKVRSKHKKNGYLLKIKTNSRFTKHVIFIMYVILEQLLHVFFVHV